MANCWVFNLLKKIEQFAYFQITKLRQVKFLQKIFPNLYITLFNFIDSWFSIGSSLLHCWWLTKIISPCARLASRSEAEVVLGACKIRLAVGAKTSKLLMDYISVSAFPGGSHHMTKVLNYEITSNRNMKVPNNKIKLLSNRHNKVHN